MILFLEQWLMVITNKKVTMKKKRKLKLHNTEIVFIIVQIDCTVFYLLCG